MAVCKNGAVVAHQALVDDLAPNLLKDLEILNFLPGDKVKSELLARDQLAHAGVYPSRNDASLLVSDFVCG